MYTAEVHLPVKHHGSTVTSDYLEKIQELIKSEALLLEPSIDISTTYVLGHTDNPAYINHYVKVYLYEKTLYLDPYAFFEQLVAIVKEKSGKDIWMFGEVKTDIPDVDTRPCPTCESKGWIYIANSKNNKVVTDCTSCKKEKRVPLKELATCPESQELEFFCWGVCNTKNKHTKVAEGVANCDDCEKLLNDKQQKVKELEEWNKNHKIKMDYKIQGMQEMETLQNHKQILDDYRNAHFKK